MDPADDVWTVGYGRVADSAPDIPFAEHWNGSDWAMSALPVSSDVLSGVAAVSATNVWAIGGDFQGTTGPLALHRTGATRSRVAVPKPSSCARYSWLTSVSALSAANIWATGTCSPAGSATTEDWVVHWNGARWAVAAVVVPAGDTLSAIAASSAHSVWAVGGRNSVGGPTLGLHYDGSTWHTLPNRVGYYSAVLGGLGDSVWVAGGGGATVGGLATGRLVGSTFRPVDVPAHGRCCGLTAMARGGSGVMWVVGSQAATDGTHLAPLVATRPSG